MNRSSACGLFEIIGFYAVSQSSTGVLLSIDRTQLEGATIEWHSTAPHGRVSRELRSMAEEALREYRTGQTDPFPAG